MLIDTLFKLSELESGPWVEGKVDPVFSVNQNHALEHALGRTSEVDDPNEFGSLFSTSKSDGAFSLVSKSRIGWNDLRYLRDCRKVLTP